jgi:hypothetical protein
VVVAARAAAGTKMAMRGVLSSTRLGAVARLAGLSSISLPLGTERRAQFSLISRFWMR